MIENIKALLKKPGEVAKPVMVANDLSAFQGLVGGYIETWSFSTDLVVICDEEGKLKGKPYNVSLLGEDFVGPILLVGVDGEEFTHLPVDVSVLKILFPQLWVAA